MVLSSVLKPDQSTRVFRKSLIIQSLHKDPVRTIQFSSLGPARSRTLSPALTREHSASLKITRPDSTQRQSAVAPHNKQPQRHRITLNTATIVRTSGTICCSTSLPNTSRQLTYERSSSSPLKQLPINLKTHKSAQVF